MCTLTHRSLTTVGLWLAHKVEGKLWGYFVCTLTNKASLKIREVKEPATRETSYLYQILKLNGQDPVFTNSQTEWAELLSPPVLYSTIRPAVSLSVSTSLVLGLKVWDPLVPDNCLYSVNHGLNKC